MGNILIIDDDKALCAMMAEELHILGHGVSCACTLDAGMRAAAAEAFDVVYLDVRMPDGNGLDMLPRLGNLPSRPEVIIMTGAGDPDGAELAIKNGAWDYLEKPLSLKGFTLPLLRALQFREARRHQAEPVLLKRDDIIGTSPQIEQCLGRIAQAAAVDANVLITGETGTGKELFARAIHRNSSRASERFVTVDCAALPVSIVEGVLFGHEKGAFTGADRSRDGMILQAHKGTLFLDEIGELPLAVQKAFLRVLQERSFRPVGGKKEVHSDFRLVVATNRNLDDMAGRERFRNDLLYRIRSIAIDLPPLRERPQDIKDLTLHYLRERCERYAMDMKGFTPEFMEDMAQYEWPGNVRELIHAVEAVLVSSRHEPLLYRKHLPTDIRIALTRKALQPKEGETPAGDPTSLPDYATYRQQADREYLRNLLAFSGGDVQEMMKRSHLSRAQIYSLMKRHGLSRKSSA